jgi:DNA-directed RNA polymerase subunit H (RpoH/RPB5)
MATLVATLSILFSLVSPFEQAGSPQRSTQAVRQLSAVRGEIVKILRQEKGTLLITVRPSRDFSEVTIIARENDLVGSAVGHSDSADLLGLLSEDDRDNETITAAELNEGDIVSVIYDPQAQNRALEIYVR